MRALFRAGAILSIFLATSAISSQNIVSPQNLGKRGAAAQAVVNALPDRIWIAPDRTAPDRTGPMTWPMFWQSAVSPSGTTLAAVDGQPLGSAPIACCAPGQPLRLHVAVPGQSDEVVKIEVARYRPLPAGVNPTARILLFGDSLSEIYLPTALRQQVQALGYKAEMVGTTMGRDWQGTADLTEGRGGKQIRDMLYMRAYSPNDINTVRPLPLGDEAKYMSLLPSGMSVVTRKYFNPFLRPASGSRFRGTIVGNHLTVTAVETGFVGLGQALHMGATPINARIVGFAGGTYGGAGDYVLDHAPARQEGEIAGEECELCINNGTIFDVRFYLSRFGLRDPDWILISAGTNDLLRTHAGPANFDSLGATIEDGVRSLYGAFRLALPKSRIAFYNVALGAGPGHDAYEPNHRFMLATTRDTVRALHDPYAFWVNTAIWQSEAHGWWVHPEGDDMTAEAKALAALIASESNPAGQDIAR